MKNIIIFVAFVLCTSFTLVPNYTYNQEDSNGTITVDTDGFGKNQNEAIINAQIKAIEIILFRGVPGGSLSSALVPNETEAKSKYDKYFKNLFRSGKYQTFITATNIISAFVKTSKSIGLQTTINYKALQIDLEQNQVIRKFGY